MNTSHARYVVELTQGQFLAENTRDKDYINEDQCVCGFCKFSEEHKPRAEKLLWMGILLPLLWVINIWTLVEGILRFRDSEPLRYNSFLQVLDNRIPQEDSINSIDDYGYLNWHYRTQSEWYRLIGYSTLGIALYGLFGICTYWSIMILTN